MPKITPVNLNHPLYKIPVIKDPLEDDSLPMKTTLNYERVKKAEIRLIEKRLIQDKKNKLSEEKYQEEVALRIKGWI